MRDLSFRLRPGNGSEWISGERRETGKATWNPQRWQSPKWPRKGILDVFGDMYFIIAYFIATANAPFGSSFSIRRSTPAISAPKRGGATRTSSTRSVGAVRLRSCSWRRLVGGLVGVGVHWFALLASLHCLPAWFAALCLLSVVSALAGFIHLLVKGTLFWFVCCASRGHRFALGTGGLKQSLLVGGIGPVYSLPKYCFKPFRRLSAVGFVLGWHREPFF